MERAFISLIIFAAFLFLSILIKPAPAYAEMIEPREPDTAKSCAICHYIWVSTFYLKHKKSPVAPFPEKAEAGSKKMCLSCHDGSVRDSRDRIFNRPGHKVGIIPSKKVSVPSYLPLNEKGGIMCSTCHSPHNLPAEDGKKPFSFFRAKNIDSSFCKICHKSQIKGVDKGNHVLDRKPFSYPSKIIASGGILGKEDNIICQTCHLSHGGVSDQLLVIPAGRICEVCHTKKPGLNKNTALNFYSHPLDILPDKDIKIPERWMNNKEVFLDEGRIICLTCHIPHGAAEKKGLLVQKNKDDNLCLQCHYKQKAIKGTKHEFSKEYLKAKRDVGPCNSCHWTHQGYGPFMWARPLLKKETSASVLCIDCHEKINTFHPFSYISKEIERKIGLPLIRTAGNENGKGMISCKTCHDPHQWNPSCPKKKGAKDEDGTGQNSFLRVSAGGDAMLCLLCHQDKKWIKNTEHDLRITCSDFKNIEMGGVCSPCHLAHNFKMNLNMFGLPPGPSVLERWNDTLISKENLNIRMCTSCHQKEKCGGGKVPERGLHPDDVFLQNFSRDFYPAYCYDGKRDDNGSIVCSTCHNPHKWEGKIEDYGPGVNTAGDITNSFLRPELAKNFCSSCHGEESLFIYRYFHRPKGRDKVKIPLPVFWRGY